MDQPAHARFQVKSGLSITSTGDLSLARFHALRRYSYKGFQFKETRCRRLKGVRIGTVVVMEWRKRGFVFEA